MKTEVVKKENKKARETLISPTGEVKFFAVSRPIANAYKDGAKEFSCKLEFDLEKHREFFEQVRAINSAMAVTKHTQRPGKSPRIPEGKFWVNLRSDEDKPPKVFDADGKEMLHIPHFDSRTDTMLASVEGVIYNESIKGSTIKLKGVKIHEAQIEPKEDLQTDSAMSKLAQAKV